MTPIVQVSSVSKSFGALEALKNVSCDVMEGEVVCIIGPSGSGKSTLLRCINHLERPSSGIVRVGGEIIGYRAEGRGLHGLSDRQLGAHVVIGDATLPATLERAGIEYAQTVVATTRSDKDNLLACQLAMQKFGKQDGVARVNNPENLDNFSALGIRVVSPVVSTAILLDSLVRQSSVMELLTSQVPGQEVCEVELHNKALAGKPLKSWRLNGDVLIALVRRNGNLFVPHGDTVIEEGDMLTLIGDCAQIDESRELVEQV